MSTDSRFEKLVETLVARDYLRGRAEQYASALADIIEEDKEGRWVIRASDGTILDRIAAIPEAAFDPSRPWGHFERETVELTDGSLIRRRLSKEESDRLHARFLERFDPETMHSWTHLEYLRSHGIRTLGDHGQQRPKPKS